MSTCVCGSLPGRKKNSPTVKLALLGTRVEDGCIREGFLDKKERMLD